SSTTPPWVANMFIGVSPSIRLFRRELARRWNFRSYSDQSTGLFTSVFWPFWKGLDQCFQVHLSTEKLYWK
ncbi:hypothetical protein N1E22_05310, partial [Pseudomonas aeruginosa]|uniref:hypothetical protein n=1 Tax=Pseudomonas aeruginosa TaxID=287 RepID=UPI002A462F42|nr:hypothetical protein [Pseudomonas aeruginosa]MCS8501365.1 hypothetical protein [Pseudomonas aeruginosa]MCS9442489.1 hypothetical protein [Pseudomonas aeruginosa]MCS9472146.1 hypothetical protein [Pseudomonas aeruginosa]MCT0473679.1 hypothetical protein [Pseudomonas aeruginosa]